MRLSKLEWPAIFGSGGNALAHRLTRIAALLRLWRHRAQSRDELLQLSDAQIRDMGLNPDWVRRESVKPFWEA